MKNILLTGAPGTGKTTVIRKVVKHLPREAQGFYTQELREDGRRTGFEIVTLSGKRAILAGTDIQSTHRVGRYGVDVAEFEKVAVAEVLTALADDGLLIIDEIGKMELFSHQFKQAVTAALDGHNPVVATLTRSRIPFVDRLKKRPDILLLHLHRTNRENLPGKILHLITNGEESG